MKSKHWDKRKWKDEKTAAAAAIKSSNLLFSTQVWQRSSSFSVSQFPVFLFFQFNRYQINCLSACVCVATNDSSSSSNLNKNLNICSCFSYFFLPIKLKRAVKSQTQQQQQKVVWNNKKERKKWEAKMKKRLSSQIWATKRWKKKGKEVSIVWLKGRQQTYQPQLLLSLWWLNWKRRGETRKKKNQSRNLKFCWESAQFRALSWTKHIR